MSQGDMLGPSITGWLDGYEKGGGMDVKELYTNLETHNTNEHNVQRTRKNQLGKRGMMSDGEAPSSQLLPSCRSSQDATFQATYLVLLRWAVEYGPVISAW